LSNGTPKMAMGARSIETTGWWAGMNSETINIFAVKVQAEKIRLPGAKFHYAAGVDHG